MATFDAQGWNSKRAFSLVIRVVNNISFLKKFGSLCLIFQLDDVAGTLISGYTFKIIGGNLINQTQLLTLNSLSGIF